MTEHYNTPVTVCPHCNKRIDSAAGMTGDSKPKANDVSVCMYCGGINIYLPNQTLRKPTAEEHKELSLDPNVIQAQLLIAMR